MQAKQDLKWAIIGCNLSKKCKVTLYKTQNRACNFCWELPVQKLGDRHPNIIEPASWLEVLAYLKYTMKIHLADIFYLFGEGPPSIFPL